MRKYRAIVQSPSAPEDKQTIWLKQDKLYHWDNGEWQSISGSDVAEAEDMYNADTGKIDDRYLSTTTQIIKLVITDNILGTSQTLSIPINTVSLTEDTESYYPYYGYGDSCMMIGTFEEI